MAKPQPQPIRPRKPRGVVAPLVPAEIAKLATVTPEDIVRIKAELVPELRELLEAKPAEAKK